MNIPLVWGGMHVATLVSAQLPQASANLSMLLWHYWRSMLHKADNVYCINLLKRLYSKGGHRHTAFLYILVYLAVDYLTTSLCMHAATLVQI